MTEPDGIVVRCVEKPGYISELTRDKVYVVTDIEVSNGTEYYVLVGDDDRPHSFLATMFREIHEDEV